MKVIKGECTCNQSKFGGKFSQTFAKVAERYDSVARYLLVAATNKGGKNLVATGFIIGL